MELQDLYDPWNFRINLYFELNSGCHFGLGSLLTPMGSSFFMCQSPGAFLACNSLHSTMDPLVYLHCLSQVPIQGEVHL